MVAKALLVGLLLHAVLAPDLPQYQAKGMGWRLALYPLVAVAVPLLHRARAGRTRCCSTSAWCSRS